MSLSVEPEDEGENVYGKTVRDLQTGVVIADDAISGTLHKQTDYKKFSGKPAEQTGYYLAIKVNAPEDATVKFNLTGGTRGEITLAPDDRQVVCRITNKDTQTIKVTAEKESQSVSKTYTLSGLVLDPGGDV